MESFRSSSRPPKCTSHLGIGLGNARFSEADGWNKSAGHEGDFIGVRHPYDWGAGDYRVRIAPDGPVEDDGEWFSLWITDLSKDETTWIGSLKFPLQNGEAKMKPHSSATIELYGIGPVQPIDIPLWHVSVGRRGTGNMGIHKLSLRRFRERTPELRRLVRPVGREGTPGGGRHNGAQDPGRTGRVRVDTETTSQLLTGSPSTDADPETTMESEELPVTRVRAYSLRGTTTAPIREPGSGC